MRILRILPILGVLAILAPLTTPAAGEVVRIESVELLDPQPHKADDAVIWYDPMDEQSTQNQYFEKGGDLVDRERLGGRGRSLECRYPAGSKGKGNRKLAFGDSPTGGGKVLKRGRQFDDIYWRIYVKHQKGWTGGGPAKMSRATIMNASNWSQAMISHVWAGGGAKLTLDPVRAARGTSCTTSKYNDWPGLKWICNSPPSQFRISATEESGRWVSVEARAKLNTPGRSDGYNCLWIDGIKQTERRNIDFRSSYTKKGINCVFLEAYWNKGSPVAQSRFYDDFVVSTKYIGPARTPLNPVLIRTPGAGAWEVEIAVRKEGGAVTINKSENIGGRNPVIGEDVQGEVVWKSRPASAAKMTVDARSGGFAGSRAGRVCLEPKKLHFCRSRAQGGEWSTWHQGFLTGELKEPAGGGPPPAGIDLRRQGGAAAPKAEARKDPSASAAKLRAEIVKNAAAKQPRVYVDFAGRSTRATLVGADASGVKATVRGMTVSIAWAKLRPERFYGIARKLTDDHAALAEYCEATGLDDEAAEERVRAGR